MVDAIYITDKKYGTEIKMNPEIKGTLAPNFKYVIAPLSGNIFCVTGPLCSEFTGHRWKASDTERWCFLWSTPEQTVEYNREAGDLRRYRAYYDFTVIKHDLYKWSIFALGY